MERGF